MEEFREPGFWETIKETFLGVRRALDCLQVEVTSRCPGRCIYCPHTALRDKWLSRDMELSLFSRLWPLMRRSSRVHLQGWGEPLLNRSFFDMAELARKAGCRVSTTTCGLRMDAEIAERVVKSGMDIVAFSLAGTTAESNRSREGVDFDRVCEAVSTLQEVRRKNDGVHLEIHFAYLMLASNMESVRGLPGLMKRLGVHAAVISTLDYIAAPGLEVEAVMPRETGKIQLAGAILKEASAEAHAMGLGFHYELPDSAEAGSDCRENIARTLFVAADGSISPCVYVNVPVKGSDPRRRVFGNVVERDPVEIWESDDFRKFREGLSSGDPDPTCRSCPKLFMAGSR
ncbi:MAG: radical SAM protein [Desulfobacteraceae bacterium]|nr:MAG: radical SAM protein [Desulfobacteraceae bacterium]